MFRPLWIEIDLKALRHNFLLIKKKLNPQTKIMAVVKQSAYGHGLVPVAKELEGLGADFFGVGSLEEAIALRKARVKKPRRQKKKHLTWPMRPSWEQSDPMARWAVLDYRCE